MPANLSTRTTMKPMRLFHCLALSLALSLTMSAQDAPPDSSATPPDSMSPDVEEADAASYRVPPGERQESRSRSPELQPRQQIFIGDRAERGIRRDPTTGRKIYVGGVPRNRSMDPESASISMSGVQQGNVRLLFTVSEAEREIGDIALLVSAERPSRFRVVREVDGQNPNFDTLFFNAEMTPHGDSFSMDYELNFAGSTFQSTIKAPLNEKVILARSNELIFHLELVIENESDD